VYPPSTTHKIIPIKHTTANKVPAILSTIELFLPDSVEELSSKTNSSFSFWTSLWSKGILKVLLSIYNLFISASFDLHFGHATFSKF
jgi:hypothetical protein